MFTPIFFLKHNNPTILKIRFIPTFFKNTTYFPTNLHFYLLSGMGSPGGGRHPQNFKNLGVTPNKNCKNLVGTSTPNSEKSKFLVAQRLKWIPSPLTPGYATPNPTKKVGVKKKTPKKSPL